jgi:HSP20 family protein
MLSTRWQPFSDVWPEMHRLHDEMNRLFGRFGWDDGSRSNLAATFPALDVWEDENRLFVEAEVPGMDLNDLEIYVTGGNQLTIKGERKQPTLENGAWHRQERGCGSFSRVFTLPLDVDADNVEARLTNGVLTIELPKREEAKPRKIAVKAD